MAKKKTVRRKRTTAAKPARRRATTRKKFDIVSGLMAVGMAAAGYVLVEYGLPKLMPTSTAKMRAGVAAAAGIALPMFMPSLMPLAIGIGAQGAVTLGRDLLKLPAPVPMTGLSAEARNRIAAMANAKRLNGYSGAQPLNGYSGGQPINGTPEMTGDRAYI